MLPPPLPDESPALGPEPRRVEAEVETQTDQDHLTEVALRLIDRARRVRFQSLELARAPRPIERFQAT